LGAIKHFDLHFVLHSDSDLQTKQLNNFFRKSL